MKVSHSSNSPSQGNEVSSSKHSGRSAPTGETKTSSAPAKVEAEKVATPDAKADISAKSKEFANAKMIATTSPDVREDRVAELKQRLAEGNYNIDSEAVADRLVEEHLKFSS